MKVLEVVQVGVASVHLSPSRFGTFSLYRLNYTVTVYLHKDRVHIPLKNRFQSQRDHHSVQALNP